MPLHPAFLAHVARAKAAQLDGNLDLAVHHLDLAFDLAGDLEWQRQVAAWRERLDAARKSTKTQRARRRR